MIEIAQDQAFEPFRMHFLQIHEIASWELSSPCYIQWTQVRVAGGELKNCLSISECADAETAFARSADSSAGSEAIAVIAVQVPRLILKTSRPLYFPPLFFHRLLQIGTQTRREFQQFAPDCLTGVCCPTVWPRLCQPGFFIADGCLEK